MVRDAIPVPLLKGRRSNSELKANSVHFTGKGYSKREFSFSLG